MLYLIKNNITFRIDDCSSFSKEVSLYEKRESTERHEILFQSFYEAKEEVNVDYRSCI